MRIPEEGILSYLSPLESAIGGGIDDAGPIGLRVGEGSLVSSFVGEVSLSVRPGLIVLPFDSLVDTDRGEVDALPSDLSVDTDRGEGNALSSDPSLDTAVGNGGSARLDVSVLVSLR